MWVIRACARHRANTRALYTRAAGMKQPIFRGDYMCVRELQWPLLIRLKASFFPRGFVFTSSLFERLIRRLGWIILRRVGTAVQNIYSNFPIPMLPVSKDSWVKVMDFVESMDRPSPSVWSTLPMSKVIWATVWPICVLCLQTYLRF